MLRRRQPRKLCVHLSPGGNQGCNRSKVDLDVVGHIIESKGSLIAVSTVGEDVNPTVAVICLHLRGVAQAAQGTIEKVEDFRQGGVSVLRFKTYTGCF